MALVDRSDDSDNQEESLEANIGVFVPQNKLLVLDNLAKHIKENNKKLLMSAPSSEMIKNFKDENRVGVVVIYVKNKQDLIEVVQFHSFFNNYFSNGLLRSIVLLDIHNSKINKILKENKVSEVVDPHVKVRALDFKIQRHIKLVERAWAQMYHSDGTTESGASPGQKSHHGHHRKKSKRANKKFQVKATAPLNTETDCWLIEKKADARKVLGKWMIDLVGPGPVVATWEKLDFDQIPWGYRKALKSLEDEQLWEWSPRNSDQYQIFQPKNGCWIFSGRQPEFKNHKWSFVSENPRLFFLPDEDGQEIGDRFTLEDESTLHLNTNSQSAVKLLPQIKETFDAEVRFKSAKNKFSTEESTLEDSRKKKRNQEQEDYLERKEKRESKELEIELDPENEGTELNYKDKKEKEKKGKDYLDKKEDHGRDLEFEDKEEKRESAELEYEDKDESESTELEYREEEKKKKQKELELREEAEKEKQEEDKKRQKEKRLQNELTVNKRREAKKSKSLEFEDEDDDDGSDPNDFGLDPAEKPRDINDQREEEPSDKPEAKQTQEEPEEEEKKEENELDSPEEAQAKEQPDDDDSEDKEEKDAKPEESQPQEAKEEEPEPEEEEDDSEDESPLEGDHFTEHGQLPKGTFQAREEPVPKEQREQSDPLLKTYNEEGAKADAEHELFKKVDDDEVRQSVFLEAMMSNCPATVWTERKAIHLDLNITGWDSDTHTVDLCFKNPDDTVEFFDKLSEFDVERIFINFSLYRGSFFFWINVSDILAEQESIQMSCKETLYQVQRRSTFRLPCEQDREEYISIFDLEEDNRKRIIDIGGGGVAFWVDFFFEVKPGHKYQNTQITFLGKKVEAAFEVLWVDEKELDTEVGQIVGGRFLDLSEESAASIEEYIFENSSDYVIDYWERRIINKAQE